jgi:hypothetical protein
MACYKSKSDAIAGYEDVAGNTAWASAVEFAPGAPREEFQRQALAAIHAFVERESTTSRPFTSRVWA